MAAPPFTRASLARRCALVLLLLGTAAACKSSRDGTTVTQPPATSSTTSSTTSTTSTTTTLPPTTTTIAVITEGGVVKVANSSGVNGAARQLTAELAALGFDTRDPTNGAGPDDDLEVSKIYVKAGSEPVAQSIAALMGGIEVFPMPTPAWIQGATEGLGDATVLVMLGHDLAGTPLSDMVG